MAPPSAAPTGPVTRVIEFNHFPRTTRERVALCLKGMGGPAPILQVRSTTGAVVGWVILGLVSAATLIGVTMAGFGSIFDCWQSPGMLVIYAAGFVFLGWSILGFLRRIKLASALPYPPGTYIFPMELVHADDTKLTIVPMGDLVSLQPVHHYRNGFYTHTMFHFTFMGGRRHSFSIAGKDRAEMTLGTLRAAQAQVSQAIADRDVNRIAALDPFFDVRMNGWQNVGAFNAQEPGTLAGSAPAWMKKGWLVGLGMAVVLSAPLWLVRNMLSDEKAFASLQRYGSTWEYEEYADHGHRHVDEVRKTLLPRAQLKDAKDKKTVTDIQKFIDDHAGQDIDPAVKAEADQALLDAIHDEYTKAKDAGTVSALRTFVASYPKAADAPAAKTQIHTLFQKTLSDFRPRATKGDPNMVPFVESLIAYEEQNGSPPLQVRFRKHNSPSLALADKILAKDAEDQGDDPTAALLGKGGAAKVTDHFDETDEDKRESLMVKSLGTAFSQVFPADVLPLKEGAPLPETNKEIDTLDAPTVLVDYTVSWSGQTYTGEKSGRSFVGIRISFDVSMHLAGATPSTDKKALKFKLAVEPPEEFTVSYDTFSDPEYGSALGDIGPGDTLVYDVMALRAFDQLSTKMQHVFFETPPKRKMAPAHKQADDDNTTDDDQR